ncbi:TIGR03089 family protein [Nocardioides sp. Root151]|uniref:TIGR03089 family protein n=1 Tax=Nocardioides sp. Root151 TaxID=1736475 RepID=UPI000703A81B|nr:TIGR03089 family protein [Nocardioides sp. Root151]KQZ75238.1 hypothetical protein ASD66_02375 [Nocardioides sp. Root151]
MAATFPALLADLLRADPGRPLVTFYDDATGERVELSVATYANWVAKTSSLFVEEFDLERGDTVLVDLPTHWLAPVFVGAAWNAGLVVSFDPEQPADLTVCGPDGLERYADSGTVLASALLPLGVRFRDPLPEGVHDFGAEVWSQPDSFIPWDPPTPDDPALAGRTQQDVLTPAGDEVPDYVAGGRLLTTANPASPRGLAGLLAPLVSGGSGIWIRNPDPDRIERRVADERATARWVV